MRVYVNWERGGWVIAALLGLLGLGALAFGVGILTHGEDADGADAFGFVIVAAVGLILLGGSAFVVCRLLVQLRRDSSGLTIVRPDWLGGTRHRLSPAEVEAVTLIPMQFRDFSGGGGDGLSDLIALLTAPKRDGYEAGLQLRDGTTVRLTHLRNTELRRITATAERIASTVGLPFRAVPVMPIASAETGGV